MDEDEELLSGRRGRRRWMVALGMLPLFGAMAFGAWFFIDSQQHAGDEARVDQITSAAFGCVAAVRGDAPEFWSLERALEHMSHMERLTRDEDDSTIAAERSRFTRLAADAAHGCQQLGELMMEAQRESRGLYFAVPAVLAHPPDQDDPARWYRRVLPETRPRAIELTRQIRVMAQTINARRHEFELMAADLPVEGRGPDQLARIVELASIPRDRENARTEAWPTPDAIVVLRRGSIPHVPCDVRFLDRASCFNEYLQRVSWEGEPGEQIALERPDIVRYWSAFAPAPDGALWAVGVTQRNSGIVGRYAPGETRPELAPVPAPVDAQTNIVIVAGGVALFPQDGTAWLTELDSGMDFERVETTPAPLVLRTRYGGAGRGVRMEAGDSLSVTGSAEDGFTSRVSSPDLEHDALSRMIDSGSRVHSIADLRALPSGRAVALLLRFSESPDAIAITTDFGRTWLGDATE